MNFFKINKGNQLGILALFLLIAIGQFIYIKMPFNKTSIIDTTTPEIIAFQAEVDSLKQLALERKKPKIYPFNPNFITDYKAYKLGMSVAEFDRLKAFRAKDKWINSPRQFQQVTHVSDSLYKALKVYFKFPDWVIKQNKQKRLAQKAKNTTSIIKDLNTASSEELQKINGVGEKLAARILKYRKKLGGFIQEKQLYEVWYLDKEVADRVLQEFKLLSKPTITKLNINNCDIDELKKVPYLNWKSAQAILEYRNEHAGIKKIADLKKIAGFPIEKYTILTLYLTIEN